MSLNLNINTITLSGEVFRRDDKYTKNGSMYVSILLKQEIVDYDENNLICSRTNQMYKCHVFGSRAKSAISIKEGDRLVVTGSLDTVRKDSNTFYMITVTQFENHGKRPE